MSDAGGLANAVLGGWSLNWAATLQGGQPFTIPCATNPVAAGTACNAILLPGSSAKTGLHIDSNNKLSFFGTRRRSVSLACWEARWEPSCPFLTRLLVAFL